jgi:general nucleoside transport system permease protein
MTDQSPTGADGPDQERPVADVHVVQAEIAEAELAEARAREAESSPLSPPPDTGLGQRFVTAVTGTGVVTTVLALFSAIVVGALLIAVSDGETREATGYLFARPVDTLAAVWGAISGAYGSLVRGAVGGVRPLSETLVSATPLILTGLAVALPFRAGLFNIGGEGQVILGGAMAGLAGFAISGLPLGIHLPLAILVGAIGGAAYGFIPGLLKAKTGAHEVIITIMLNNIAIYLLDWLLLSDLFRQPDRSDPISQSVEASAMLPRLFGSGYRVHAGLILAIIAAVAIFWLIERSTAGFELRAVGANPDAATTAGMSVPKVIILVMTTAGALAGLAGATNVLGVAGRITPGFSAGAGFDGITVALLGRGNPFGVVAAGLLFGGLRAGGLQMQAQTGVSVDLIVVVQALIVVFIAAPALVRAIYGIRAEGVGTDVVAKGWGA